MSQDYRVPIDHDIPVSAIVTDINPSLEAIRSNFAGASDPEQTIPGQIWYREDEFNYYYADENNDKRDLGKYINDHLSIEFINAEIDFHDVNYNIGATYEQKDVSLSPSLSESNGMSIENENIKTNTEGRFMVEYSINVENKSNQYNTFSARLFNVTSGTQVDHSEVKQTLFNVSGTTGTVNFKSSIYLQAGDEVRLDVKSEHNSRVNLPGTISFRKIEGSKT